MKKLALALIAASAAVFGLGSVAEAQYGTTPAVGVSPATVVSGGTVTVTATGCTPPEIVTFAITGGDSKSATCASASALGEVEGLNAQTGGTGTASVQLTAPVAAGTYPGTAVGTLGFNQPFSVIVTAAVVPPAGLPATGSGGLNTSTGIALGLLVVGLGLFGVAQVRRRQNSLA